MSNYTLTTSIPINVEVSHVSDKEVLFSAKYSNYSIEYTLSYKFDIESMEMVYYMDGYKFDNLTTAMRHIDSGIREYILSKHTEGLDN